VRASGWLVPLSLLAGGVLAARIRRGTAEQLNLRGAVVVITGGSRGLGLALGRELAVEGSRLSICARDEAELDRARSDLESRGAQVLATPCNVADHQQVKRLIQATTQRFGAIDVLINCAGVITVGPFEDQTLDDLQLAMDVMYWGSVYTALEVLPQMRARRSGQIVNITSIGGKVSVPRLVPYSAAKFAAVGFSEGLHAELAEYGIHVLTVVPGLMRTGSHLNALFKGQHRKEFTWFSLGASLPVSSTSAEDAARRIVRAIKARDTELIITWQAHVLARLHGLAPGLNVNVLSTVSKVLPGPGGIGTSHASGRASETALTRSPVEHLGHTAAERLNQT